LHCLRAARCSLAAARISLVVDVVCSGGTVLYQLSGAVCISSARVVSCIDLDTVLEFWGFWGVGFGNGEREIGVGDDDFRLRFCRR